VVELPYSIIETFTERRVSFTVISGDTVYTFQPGFLDSPELHGFSPSRTTAVKLTVTERPAYLPALSFGENYAVTPQTISLTVGTGVQQRNVQNLISDVLVTQRISRVTTMDHHVNAVTRLARDLNWNRVEDGRLQAGALTFSTFHLGTFAAVYAAAPVQTTEDNAVRSAILYINSRLRIQDITTFEPTGIAPTIHFHNLVLAVTQNRPVVELHAPIAERDMRSLQNGRMWVPGAAVRRQEGVAAIIRLYEVRTGFPVSADVRNAFGAFNTNPTANLNIGDMFLMFEMVLRDS
jgi:hypothetical protein